MKKSSRNIIAGVVAAGSAIGFGFATDRIAVVEGEDGKKEWEVSFTPLSSQGNGQEDEQNFVYVPNTPLTEEAGTAVAQALGATGQYRCPDNPTTEPYYPLENGDGILSEAEREGAIPMRVCVDYARMRFSGGSLKTSLVMLPMSDMDIDPRIFTYSTRTQKCTNMIMRYAFMVNEDIRRMGQASGWNAEGAQYPVVLSVNPYQTDPCDMNAVIGAKH